MYTRLLDESLQRIRNPRSPVSPIAVTRTTALLETEWSMAQQLYRLALRRVKDVTDIRSLSDLNRFVDGQPDFYSAASKTIVDESINLIDELEALRAAMLQQQDLAPHSTESGDDDRRQGA